jgi:hypothetical protein
MQSSSSKQISDPAVTTIVTLAEAGSILLFLVMIAVWCGVFGGRI